MQGATIAVPKLRRKGERSANGDRRSGASYRGSLTTAAELRGRGLRIPTKPAMHSNTKPATYSNLKPASVPI